MSARLNLRRRLQLSVIGAVGLVLVLLIGAFNLVLRDRLSAEANNALFERASAELGDVEGDRRSPGSSGGSRRRVRWTRRPGCSRAAGRSSNLAAIRSPGARPSC